MEAWLIGALGGERAGPVEVPVVRLSVPVTVRVVPAAIEVVGRTSTALRLCEPVIVPPAKTSVEVPGSSVPAVYVQLLVVRMVPARVSVPGGLVDDDGGQVAAGRGRRPGEGLGGGCR